MPKQPHPLQPYWDRLFSSVQADLLETALQLGLFDQLQALAPQAVTATQLAGHLKLDPQRLVAALELLTAMNLLERQALHPANEPRQWLYRNSQVTRRYLCRTAPDSCVEAWQFRLQTLRALGQNLPQLLQAATPVPPPSNGEAWARAARTQLRQEQRAITAPAALAIVQALPQPLPVRQFADFGCGAGEVALALADYWPDAQCTLVDLAEPVAVAKQHLLDAGMAGRVRAHSGSLAEQQPAGGYDLIWCSSVLHFVPDLMATLADLHSALAPGGLLLSAHAEIPVQPDHHAEQLLSYYLSLQLRGQKVGHSGELTHQLQQTGFTDITTWVDAGFALTPLTLHLARKSA